MTVGVGVSEPGDLDERRKMGRQMAQALEWAVFAYQFFTLIQTAWINPFSLLYRVIVLSLAATHAVLAVRVLTKRQLIAGNPRWMVSWMVVSLAVPLAIALMIPHHLFATNVACVAACTYPAPVLLIVSLYPWVFVTAFARRFAGLILITCLLAEWVTLVYLLGGRLTPTAGQSVAVSVMWVVAAYGLGIALRRLIDVWLRNRNDIEQKNFDTFMDFLHSHIKAGLAAAERESPNVEGMLEKIHDLQTVIGEKRMKLLLSKDQVPLAMLFSERIRVFNGLVHIESPRLGARTAPALAGRLLDRALGDLLKNAVIHGARSVQVEFTSEGGDLILNIIDDGPGFDSRVLDDPGKTVSQLRQSARDLRGDLTVKSGNPHGSRLTLVIPEHPAAAKQEDANARAAHRRPQPASRASQTGTAGEIRLQDDLGPRPT